MELRQLGHFVAVAEEGVFARAATRCRIAPSGLSTSIRALEADLGAALFSRTTRRVTLTAAGHALLPEARATLAAAASARSAVDGVTRGSFTVGGIPTPGLLDQATALERFATRYPEVEVRYLRDTSDGLLDQVLGRRLDLAVVSLPSAPPAGVTVRELARGRVRLACRADHRFAGRRSVTCGEVAGEKLVTARPGSRGHDYLDRIFAAAGRPRTAPHEVHDVPTMLEFIDRGLGVALVVDGMTAGRPDLATVEISDGALDWTLAAVTPLAATPAARAFLAELG